MNDKEEMLAALAKEPDMVAATAYLYAVNMHRFGKDVTEKWLTAVENSIALDEAYMRGRIDSDKEWVSHGIPLPQCKNCKYFVDGKEVDE